MGTTKTKTKPGFLSFSFVFVVPLNSRLWAQQKQKHAEYRAGYVRTLTPTTVNSWLHVTIQTFRFI
jgi:hypothetical protein